MTTNTQYTHTIIEFSAASTNYGTAITSLRNTVGHTDSSTISDAVSLEKAWQAFLSSPEYKDAAGIIKLWTIKNTPPRDKKAVALLDFSVQGKAAQDLMRKSMQRIRAKCGYTCDRAGKISVKKAIVRGTKERAEVSAKPAAKELAAHSIASPTEAAKVVSAISRWETAIGAVIDSFKDEMPPEILSVLRNAVFGIAKAPTKAKQKA